MMQVNLYIGGYFFNFVSCPTHFISVALLQMDSNLNGRLSTMHLHYSWEFPKGVQLFCTVKNVPLVVLVFILIMSTVLYV